MTLPRSPKLAHSRKSRLEASTVVVPPVNTGTGNNRESLTDETHNDGIDEITMNLENLPPLDNIRGNQVSEIFHQQRSEAKVVTSTPIRNALDEMDKFAFPFTPETPRRGLPNLRSVATVITKNAVNVANVEREIVIDDKLTTVRRETFVVDEETQVNKYTLPSFLFLYA